MKEWNAYMNERKTVVNKCALVFVVTFVTCKRNANKSVDTLTSHLLTNNDL